MLQAYIQNKLYLTQFDLTKKHGGVEILPLNFNYQGLIIITTELVKNGGQRLVTQTHSCGCGPQPTIRGGILEKIVPWTASTIRKKLADSGKNKEVTLSNQTLVDEVYVLKKPISDTERTLIIQGLQKYFGGEMEIGFFF